MLSIDEINELQGLKQKYTVLERKYEVLNTGYKELVNAHEVTVNMLQAQKNESEKLLKIANASKEGWKDVVLFCERLEGVYNSYKQSEITQDEAIERIIKASRALRVDTIQPLAQRIGNI